MGRRYRLADAWNLPRLVSQMLRLLAFAILLMPGAFLASPLTADDLYGAPDPGWYNAGSGWSREGASGSAYGVPDYRPRYDAGDDGYGYGAGGQDMTGVGGYRPVDPGRADQGWADGRSGYRDPGAPDYRDPGDAYARERRGYYDGYPDGGERWQRPQASPEPAAPDGYGAPDWAQRTLPPSGGYNPRSPNGYTEGYAPGQDVYGDGRAPWREPVRPQYRFREDAALEQHGVGANTTGYRFRPLTAAEQERRRDPDPQLRFAEPDRAQRYRPRDVEDRGAAFGYAPGPAPPEDFYQRYYRSGP